MKILGIQKDHNASACLFIDNELVYYNQEERLSRNKKDSGLPVETLKEILKVSPEIDVLLISGYDFCFSENFSIISIIKKLGFRLSDSFHFEPYYKAHHLFHASKAFYSSKFDQALVFVCDGKGSSYNLNNGDQAQETTSIFDVTSPNTFDLVYRRFFTYSNITENLSIIWNNALGLSKTPVSGYSYKNAIIEIRNDFDLGYMYEGTSRSLGLNDEGGKMMSLQSFGDENPKNTPPVLINNSKFNMDIFDFNHYNMHLGFNTRKYHELNLEETKLNFARQVQTTFQTLGLNLIEKTLQITNQKNLVLTGGTALNIVANAYYRENLPDDINIYADPLCGDEGNCIGICQHYIHHKINSKKINLSMPIYIGGKTPTYDYNLLDNEVEIKDADEDLVTELLRAGNIVALFQGKAEAGPRALGNRSILYDPRVKNGKTFTNKVKGREEFRPFAASVMQEYANDWFHLDKIYESPYMMFAVDVRTDKLTKIPAVLHVDNTSRIQTVTETQNKEFYKIIKSFYNKTGIPMLLNTSFNLAGDPIVETIQDALNSLRKSRIEYLYLPEIKKIIYVKN